MTPESTTPRRILGAPLVEPPPTRDQVRFGLAILGMQLLTSGSFVAAGAAAMYWLMSR